ncbi:MAG: hypothetical protein MJ072_04145, partial [Clostridia bacterium]|nr:hypothetical protein [Clostridia bacterium]
NDCNRYVEERDERENRKTRNPDRTEAMKNDYKTLKNTFESYNWFSKFIAKILPWFTDAGKALQELNEGKNLLLDTGITEAEIGAWDAEADAERNRPAVQANANPNPAVNVEQPNNGEILEGQTGLIQDNIETHIQEAQPAVKKEENEVSQPDLNKQIDESRDV